MGAADTLTTEIFRFEYHHLDGTEYCIRVVLPSTDDELWMVKEKRTEEGWKRMHREVIDYFAYSDEDSASDRSGEA